MGCGSRLLLRPDEVESSRRAGEGRHPVSENNRRLDPGLRRGDAFKHHRAASRGLLNRHFQAGQTVANEPAETPGVLAQGTGRN